MVIRDLANWGGEGDEEGEPEIESVKHLKLVPSYTSRLEDAQKIKWAFFGTHLKLQIAEHRSNEDIQIAARASLFDREQQIRAAYNASNWALAAVGATLQALIMCENLVDEIYDFIA